MIVERVSRELDKCDLFDENISDGRLTEQETSNNVYNLREAILYSKKMGRPLTDDEMKRFEV